jgi:hypothetical protein
LKELVTSIEINSDPEKIWKVLTDFEHYSYWNPFIISIAGSPIKGQKIQIELRTAEGKTRVYRPVITKVQPPTELRWYGRALFPRILDGEHIFMIQENQERVSTFTQKEIFKGIGIYLGGNKMFEDIRKGFQMMNSNLKTRSESTD